MNNLPIIDIAISVCYLLAMVGIGFYFSKKNKNADEFTRASGKIPGWAIGLSIYATFLSSNTFLGNPGKAFGSNWNVFVFSISMPLAAWVATKYFVPFYKKTNKISMEKLQNSKNSNINAKNVESQWQRSELVLSLRFFSRNCAVNVLSQLCQRKSA